MKPVQSPWPQSEMNRFLESYFYSPEAFMITAVTAADKEAGTMEAVWHPDTALLMSRHQRLPETQHPRHVAGADQLMMTVSLGSLHAWFFHGCRWDEGWVGYGSRMERVEYVTLAKHDQPVHLKTRETRRRVGSKRVYLEMEFLFSQNGEPVYRSTQTALFVRTTGS